ncbi:hypothetical protein COJ24_13355 [Bacillus cereus]|nr:hypothetical protein COJ24_13355 [Bacillus cereus]
MGIHTEVHDNKKAPRNQGLQHPAILNEPLSLLVYPAPSARISGRFAPSFEGKSASESGAPSPCDSERAASAFSY